MGSSQRWRSMRTMCRTRARSRWSIERSPTRSPVSRESGQASSAAGWAGARFAPVAAGIVPVIPVMSEESGTPDLVEHTRRLIDAFRSGAADEIVDG
jgi:hypothetical protein